MERDIYPYLRGDEGYASTYLVCPLCPMCKRYEKGPPQSSSIHIHKCNGNFAKTAARLEYEENKFTNPKNYQVRDSCNFFIDKLIEQENQKRQAEEKEANEQKKQAEKEAYEQRKRAEQEANERRIREEKEAYERLSPEEKEAIEQKRRAEKEACEQRRQAEKEAKEAEVLQRKRQLSKLMNEAELHGKNNNLICVNIFLPIFNEEFNIKNEILSFLESNDKIEKFINTFNYELGIIVNIPKEGLNEILKSGKLQDYSKNKNNNDMFAFKNKEYFVILPPEIILKHVDDNTIDTLNLLANIQIWLKYENLKQFVKEYNNLIIKYKKLIKKRKPLISILLCFSLLGIIILILIQMCK